MFQALRSISEASSWGSTRAEVRADWQQSSMYAYINCLNKLSVDAGGGAGAGSCAVIALGLAGRGPIVQRSVSEKLELLEWVDLPECSLARLQAMLWVTTPRKGPWQRDDGAIIQKIG